MAVINVADIFAWSRALMLLVIHATAYTFKIAAIYRVWIRQKIEQWENSGKSTVQSYTSKIISFNMQGRDHL